MLQPVGYLLDCPKYFRLERTLAGSDLHRRIRRAFARRTEQSGLTFPTSTLPPRVIAKARRQGALPWSDLNRTFNRLPSAQAAEIILEALLSTHYVVFIDSLEVSPTQAALFADILEHAQVFAAMDVDNRRKRIEKVLWRFQQMLELRPLPEEDCLLISEHWLAQDRIRFSNTSVKPCLSGLHKLVRSRTIIAGVEPMLTGLPASPLETESTLAVVTG